MSKTLSSELRKLRDSLRSVPIEYDPLQNRFVYHNLLTGADDVKVGLTGVLKKAFSVPEGKLVRSKSSSRKSPNDPVIVNDVWVADGSKKTSMLQNAAASCSHATLQCTIGGLDDSYGSAGFGPAFNKRHGILVDEQLKFAVAHGQRALVEQCGSTPLLAGGIDPCVATLLDYFNARDVALFAAQVPLYSPEMNIATALDALGTDRKTQSRVILYEIKASAIHRQDDRSYTALRGRLRGTVARGTPLSYYSQHQLQAWTMRHMMHSAHKVAPHETYVVRVTGCTVYTYPLNIYYERRAAKLVPAMRRRGKPARKKRARSQFEKSRIKPQRVRRAEIERTGNR